MLLHRGLIANNPIPCYPLRRPALTQRMDAGRLFGTSGIRGIVNQDLSPDFCRRVASAIGTALPPASRVGIATDTRITRNVIKDAIIAGLLSCSINVADLGVLPTPALASLTRQMGFAAGIMVTASHNPPEFNGIKLFGADSVGYSPAQEAEIERVYFDQRFRQGKRGTLEQGHDMKQRYFSFLTSKFPRPEFNHHLRVVVDPGNGAASKFAGDIFVQMGLDVIPVNDEPDGLFPGRGPEPGADTLQGTVAFLRKHNADLAVCFDGDADRVVFCDREGFLGFSEPIAFISRLAVQKTGKKTIATTVETGALLDLAVKDLGAEVIRGKVGDVAVAHLARELDAALGVEQVGVYIMPEAGYYPDSIFASLSLLGELSNAGQIREYFRGMPGLFFEKARVSCPDELKESVMARAMEKARLFAPDEINTLDGLRLEFPDSWMLIRASGTEPVIRVISESASRKQTDELIRKGEKLVGGLVEASR